MTDKLITETTNISDTASSRSQTEWFGNEQVASGEKKKRVGDVFHSVASKYDIMNDVTSFGVHRLWKDRFVSQIAPRPGMKLLDVAGGTGDISFRFLKSVQKQQTILQAFDSNRNRQTAFVCDINPSMLSVGRQRALDRGFSVSPENNPTGGDISFICGDAENLPFPDHHFDVYTIAFGLRNVTDIPKALSEAYRVLRPGGHFLCLEFSQVGIPVLEKLYDAYSFHIMPKLGQWIAGDSDSYQYLVESIRRFPPQQQLVDLMQTTGFAHCRYTNLTGGIAAIHSGWRI